MFAGKPQRRAGVADRAAGIEASQSEPAFLAQYFYEATNCRYFLHFLLESVRKEQLGKNCLEFHEAVDYNPRGLTLRLLVAVSAVLIQGFFAWITEEELSRPGVTWEHPNRTDPLTSRDPPGLWFAQKTPRLF